MTDAAVFTASIIHKRLLELLPWSADEDVKEVAAAAFRLARDENYGWMLVDDDQRFRAGIGALLLRYNRYDAAVKARIDGELRVFRAMAAATQGVPVDMARVLDETPEPIGLYTIFRDAT